MLLSAFLALQAAPAAANPQDVAAQRFVSACLDGQIRSADLQPVAASAVPGGLRHRYRQYPNARYYRFDDRRPSYLMMLGDPRPGAEFHEACVLASRAGGIWALFSRVANSFLRDTAHSPLTVTDEPGRYAAGNTLSASYTDPEEGYTVQAVRAGGYTLLEAVHFRVEPKDATGRATGGAASSENNMDPSARAGEREEEE